MCMLLEMDFERKYKSKMCYFNEKRKQIYCF